MNRALLNLKPTHWLCPLCGKWHEWTSDKELGDFNGEIECPNTPKHVNFLYEINFSKSSSIFINNFSYYFCWGCDDVDIVCDGETEIFAFYENTQEPIVTLKTTAYRGIDTDFNNDDPCENCKEKGKCWRLKLIGKEGSLTVTLGFKFSKVEYDKIVKGAQTSKQPKIKNKEDIAMATTTKTSIKAQLLDHSPKENMELVKNWAIKYKPVLKWAVPVASIYAAYRILNSKNSEFTINNIGDVCEEKLGFDLEPLKNKKALKELMVIGGLSAGAYGALKAFAAITNSEDSADVSVEEIEEGMSKLEDASKKFAWLQPKTEAMLPVAISVIIVSVMANPLKLGIIDNAKKKVQVLTEDWSIKCSVFAEMAKLFIQDKFDIDLSSEEEHHKFKKFAFLAAIGGVLVFLYGKNLLGNKAVVDEGEEKAEEENPEMEAFMSQLLDILKKLAPTVFAAVASILVSKKLLKLDEEVIDMESVEEMHNPEEGAVEVEEPQQPEKEPELDPAD